jgi:KTSC domain
MERKRISSSKIRGAGYDPKAQLLEIEFSDGRVVQYSGVSQEVHRQFMAAPSAASFFEDKIDENYSSRRLK